MSGSAERPSADREFSRGGEEFGRVLAFSDGMFAIAMTLLVVAIGVPALSDGHSVGDLADALNDQSDAIVSFFISFAVIGRYWVAHHQMFSLLRAFDRGLIGLNLLYLGFIAFLPFPTALLGSYFDNPLAVAVYAAAVAVISGLEVVLLRHAYRNGLLTKPMPEEVYRWGVDRLADAGAVLRALDPAGLRQLGACGRGLASGDPVRRVRQPPCPG